MASANQTCPRTGQGQQNPDGAGATKRREGRAASRSPFGRRTDLRYWAAGLSPRWPRSLRLTPSRLGRTYAARTSRASGHPASSENTYERLCRAKPQNPGSVASAHETSSAATKPLQGAPEEGRSPVNRGTDAESQSNLPPDGAGATKRREGSRSRSPPRQCKHRRGRGGGPLTSMASLSASLPSRLPANLSRARAVAQGGARTESRNLRRNPRRPLRQ
jgi:hypothetical protein